MLQSIPFKFPNIENVFCAFQVRNIPQFPKNAQERVDSNYVGGNISYDVSDNPEDVKNNRAEICSTFNVDSFCDVLQVHGVKTIFEPEDATAEKYAPYEADGLASSKTNQALCIKSADCQPILLADMKGEFILALHAGWKGNRLNYPYIAVKEFCEHYNVKAQNLCAVRGPSLSPAVSEFINYDSEWGAEFNAWYNEKNKTVDMWELTKSQLKEAGLLARNIYSLDLCTYSNPHLFYSFRHTPMSGRQGSFIWKK